MYKRRERARGVKVQCLNYEQLTELVKNALVATHGGTLDELDNIKPWVQYTGEYFDEAEGRTRMVLINTEGVGYASDEMNRCTVLYDSNGFGGNGWIDLHRSLIETCHTGEFEDLAVVIREFGDRLETNFDIWHGKLSK
jgi:hypothetical protein